MEERSPTAILEAEHHVIQKIVGAMALLAEGLEAGKDPDPETLRSIVEFMRIFADKCHHGKEEVHLFPLLEAKGVPARGCPIGILLHEHDRGRTLVGQLAEALEAQRRGETGAGESILKSLRGLIDLYPGHIWKEEYLLFPMTNKILGAEDQTALRERFAAVEAGIGSDVHRRLERLAEDIERGAQAH